MGASLILSPGRSEGLQFLRYALLAPSPFNAQPWWFRLEPRALSILPDRSRYTARLDPDGRLVAISVGTALENLVVAARQNGYLAEVENDPSDLAPGAVRVRLFYGARTPAPELFRVLTARQTNRSLYGGGAIPLPDLRVLEAVALEEGIALRLFTRPPEFEPLIATAVEAVRQQLADTAYVEDAAAWQRTTRQQIERRGDGLAVDHSGIPSVPRWAEPFWLGGVRRSQRVALRQAEAQLRSASALAILSVAQDDPHHWRALGRSLERFTLQATALGLAHAHLDAPCLVVGPRQQLRRFSGSEPAWPQILLRLGYAAPTPHARRRHLEDLLLVAESGASGAVDEAAVRSR